MSVMQFRHFAAGLALGLLALGAAQPALADDDRRIAITGRAEVTAVPDRADVTLGVDAEGKTAAAAMAENARRMSAVFEALTAAGVAREKIGTTGLSLQPVYDYPHQQGRNGPPRLVGFRASNMVQVRVSEMDSVGKVLDATVEAGANTIHGISFSVSEADRLLDTARAEAVADARRKAEIYAKAAGVRLGKVLRIDEAGGGGPQPLYRVKAMAMEAMRADTPVAPGEQTLGISVSVLWELED